MHTDEPPTYIHTNAIYKTPKRNKNFFKIMVEVDAGIFYNKSAKSKGRKAKRKGQSYVVVTLSLLTRKRHQIQEELKRRVHLLSVAVSSQLIQH